MEKDYKNFSGVANTRFKGMASHFGFVEVSKEFYAKLQDDIFYVFCLQKSVGNDFFYINYGIAIPYLWSKKKELDFKSIKGWHFGQRLEDAYRQGFDCRTKAEIEEKAELAKSLFQQQAIPWFSKFQSLRDAAELYFTRDVVTEENIGTERNANSIDALNYAFFHYHLGDSEKARIWFKEAKRIISLPVYYETRGNMTRLVRERPKGARQYKPDQETLDKLKLVDEMLSVLNK